MQWNVDNDGNIIRNMVGICDSTWGSDPDDGRSVSSYILYFMGVPISWRSKTQSHVTLSSSEAEYVSLSELVKEIKFVLQITDHLNIHVQLPIKIHIDNVGAIFMARNNAKGGATRHVNYRYNYSREVHGKLIETVFIKTQDNEADILTKNATKAEFDRHACKLVTTIPKELLANLENMDEESKQEDKEDAIVKDESTKIIKN